MTIALLFSLGTCIVQKQNGRVNFACTERLFNLSAEAILRERNARLCVKCAIFLLKIKQFLFSCHLVTGFTFLKKLQNQFKMLLEMGIVLASIAPLERKTNLLTLCNNSEIYLWLWKVWSLVARSQISFYVTRARKDDKNRQNTLFHC